MTANLYGILEDVRTLAADRRAALILTATFAVAFGAFLVYGTGFAYSSALHSVAHDTRHAFVFPCH